MLELFEQTADSSVDRPLRTKTKTTTQVPVPFVVVFRDESEVSLLGQLVGKGLDLGA